MTFNQALEFNPEIVIHNPALILTYGATVNGALEVHNNFCTVRVSVELAGSAFIMSMDFEEAIWWLSMVDSEFQEYRIIESFGGFSVSTLI